MNDEDKQPVMRTVRFPDLDPIPAVAFALVVAADIEREWMLRRMKPLASEPSIIKVGTPEGTYYLGQCGHYPCVLVSCDAGSGGRSGSTLTVTDAIGRWRPYAVLLTGIAFGADKNKQRVGDVLVSTQVIPYELERISAANTEPRGPRPEAHQTLLDRARNLGWFWIPEGETSARAPIRGPILSGEKLVDNKKFRDELVLEYPNAVGGEMEGAGLYAAAERRRRPWLIVKGICDWGYRKTKDYQPLAAKNATSFIQALLSEPTLRAEDLDTYENPAETRAEREFRQQTRSTRFHELRVVAREAYRVMEARAKALHEFLLENQTQIDITAPKEPSFEAYVAKLNSEREIAVEFLLNAYNSAASAMLSDEIDQNQFLSEMSTEIVELCEDDDSQVRSRMHPREKSAYSAIWTAYDEIKDSAANPGR